jgi:hypothetical protein
VEGVGNCEGKGLIYYEFKLFENRKKRKILTEKKAIG